MAKRFHLLTTVQYLLKDRLSSNQVSRFNDRTLQI
jgi:hypothetical protein